MHILEGDGMSVLAHLGQAGKSSVMGTDQHREPVVMWGAGGHATVVAECIHSIPRFVLAGVLVDPVWIASAKASLAHLVIGGMEQLPVLRDKGIWNAVVAVGQNDVRVAISQSLIAHGLSLPTLVSPSARVSPSATIGDGSVILPGAVINADARIGRFCIINTGAIVEHGVELGDGVHVCPRAVIAGDVKVGSHTWLGLGAMVIEKLTIGSRTMIGAGAVVVDNVPSDVVAYGVPARIRRQQHQRCNEND
jgi:sugar O-acyltransferase (sialic acid O-acetyltransferase NeuD family)